MTTGTGIRLPSFPDASGFTDTDLIFMTQSGATVKGTVAQLRTALASNRTVETFVAGTDFTAGTTPSLTLVGAYGSINNIDVYFDGVPQLDCALSGHALSFNPVIPLGTSQVVVKGSYVNSIGVPSDGSVTDVKAAARSALFNRIFDPINPKDPAYGALGNTVVSGGSFVSGNDDTSAIQAAAAAAHSRGGGRIELTNGIFSVSAAIQLYDNVEIVGKGGRIFYKKPGVVDQHCIILQGKRNAVRDLHIFCDPSWVRGDTGFGIAAFGATDAVIEGCTLENIASAAIWVTNSTNTRVIGNRVISPKADGIHFSDGAIGFLASGNIVTGSQDDAIAVVLDTVGAVQPQNGAIVGNLVNGTTSGHGVVFIGCVNVTITGNTLVYIGSASGIGNYQWNADTRVATNVLIAGNTISRTGLTVGSWGPTNPLGVHGILLGFCANTRVIGNSISDISDNAGFTSAGVFLYAYNNVTVKGNAIENCASHGVWVYDATPSASSSLVDLHIDDNKFFNVVKYAIKANPTTAFLNGVFVTNNKYKDCSYDASVSNVVASLGRTQSTPLRYYGNIMLNRETSTVLLDATNASDIREANNIPSF